MATEIRMCPVCRHETDYKGSDCPNCGVEFALVTFFADESSFKTWQDMILSERKKRTQAAAQRILKDKITLESTYMCMHRDGDDHVTLFKGDGVAKRIDNVVQYSTSTRNTVMLKSDGTLACEGECRYELGDLKNIVCIYAEATAVYAVTRDGDVIVRGVSSVLKQVSRWRGVKKLIGNRGRLVALTVDGRVLIADDTKSNIEIPTSAVNAVDIATTYNFTVWLNSDGTVGYSGRDSDARAAVREWKNIKAVAIENHYAVGLTDEGRVLLAGTSVSGTDLGRSEAAEWKNVIYITCSNSSVAGIFSDGSVKIKGNVENKEEIARDLQKEIIKYL